MTDLFKILIELSVSGGVIVLCMLILKPIYDSALTAKWNYAIRKFASLFFLVPVWFIVQGSLAASINTNSFIASIPIFTRQETTFEQSLSIGLATTILGIWVAGVIIFGAWYVYCYLKFSREMKSSNTPAAADSEVYQLLNYYKETMGIKGNVQLVYNDKIASPALIGLLKPTIILPVGGIPVNGLGMVLQHELIHFKRKDLWLKIFMLVVSAVHWFNPFVHILRKEMMTWSELSCDEELVKDMSYRERKQYGETILNMLEARASKREFYSALFSGNIKSIKKRLLTVLQEKKVNKKIAMIAIIVVVGIGAIGTTASAWASDQISIVDGKRSDTDMTLEEYIKWLENYSYEEALASGATPDSEEAVQEGAQEIIKQLRALSEEEQEKFMFYINNPEEMFEAARDDTNKDVYLQ